VTTQNIPQIFVQSVEKFNQRSCFRFKKEGKWKTLTWTQVYERVRLIALGLKALGLQEGDRVALFAPTSLEWTLCDLAILSTGGVTVPVYQSSTPEQVSYILRHSGARWVFVGSDPLYEKILSAKRDLPPLERIILISGTREKEEGVVGLGAVQAVGEEADEAANSLWRKGIDRIRSRDTATIVYTSGTTGPPKGAELTHGNFLAEIDALTHLFEMRQGDVSILFLPLAHIMARVIQFIQIRAGFAQAYAEIGETLIEEISEIRPHFLVAVPRLFEKAYEQVHKKVEMSSPMKKGIFAWSVAVGQEISKKKQERKIVSPLLRLRGWIADLLLFRKVRRIFGGRVRFVVSGGAPLSRQIAEFFHAAGLLILEAYGLTETTGAIYCNTHEDFRFGTVGKRVNGMVVKIASDGEIMTRGPTLFQGYYRDPERTRRVLMSDGWFKTGDIGEIDQDGYLKITDRKKDIIVTAGGKNVAPQNIENLLKTIPFVSQVVVHGDQRKYLTALVTLNEEPVSEFAKNEGISYSAFKELARHPRVFELLKKAIEEKNRELASFETIKRFAILEDDFTEEAGELTPTLKVKRKFVNQKYKEVLDQLYREE
jgi:long-chain acyl-CoA synthetase